jgi:selenocysteine lyase/cysteine desulfurase
MYSAHAIREHIPLLQTINYLNTGTEGLVAHPVEDKVVEMTRLYDEGGFHTLHILEEQTEVARKMLAEWLNVSPDELALTDNASHSVGIVTAGLEWKPGDEVLMSDEEHPALLLNCYNLVERAGVTVKRFTLSHDPEVVLSDLERLATPRTRLIATSHIGALTGTRVPVKQIAAFARERGILSLIDGAQAVAQFPIDVAEIGCDFYVSNGHKWLHGPKGTGLLIIKKERLDEVRPLFFGTTAAAYPLPEGTKVVLNPTAKRYEFATRNFATYVGMIYALEWLNEIGWDNIVANARLLSDYCKERVRQLPGAHLRTPLAWEHSSGLLGFSIDAVDGVDLREWLRWNKNISARRVLEYSGLRLSCAYFNTLEDVDLFFDTVPEYPKWPHGKGS